MSAWKDAYDVLGGIRRRLAEQARAATDAAVYEALDRARALGGWGWYGDWVCDDCKRPQLGDKPYGEDRFRCVACGPGDGLAPCPADHQGNKKACILCRGAGYVEAI